MSTDTSGNKRKNTGDILLGIGITVAIISFVMLFAGCSSMTNMDDPEHMAPAIFGGLGILISFFMIAIGLRLKKAGLSATALFCGIFSILLPVFGIISGLLAIIFGAASLTQLKENPSSGSRTTAIAGLVMGIISIVIWTCCLTAWFWW